jgi:hypothetical protein
MEAVRAPIYDLIHANADADADFDITVKHSTKSTGLSQIISEAPYNWFAMGREEWEGEKEKEKESYGDEDGDGWRPSKAGWYVAREEGRGEEWLRERLRRRWGFGGMPDLYERYEGDDC